MRNFFILTTLILLFGSCRKDQFNPDKETSLRWKCGEDWEQVVEELAVKEGSNIELTIESIDFCAGANGIEIEIWKGDQLLVHDEAFSLPKVIQLPISESTQLQISTKVIPGPALILCSRLGRAKVLLNYFP